jgi:hypothetical protein
VIAPAPGMSNASGVCRVLTRLCGLRGRQVISGERQDAVDRIQRRPVRQQSRVRGRVPVATSSSASGRRWARTRTSPVAASGSSRTPSRRRLSHLIDLELVEVPAPGPVRELPLNPLLVWWGLDDATLTRGVSTEACAPPVSRDRRPGGHRGTLPPKQARAYGASRRSLLVQSGRLGVVNETLAGVWLRACPWSTGLLLPRTVSRARSQGGVGCWVLGATGPQEKAGHRARRPTDKQ